MFRFSLSPFSSLFLLSLFLKLLPSTSILPVKLPLRDLRARDSPQEPRVKIPHGFVLVRPAGLGAGVERVDRPRAGGQRRGLVPDAGLPSAADAAAL